MIKKATFFLLLAIATCQTLYGQNDSGIVVPASNSHLRISLLTGGSATEIWETFGHACVRVIDSTKYNWERDIIYDYALFNAYKGTVLSQLLSGRAEVLVDTLTFDELLASYKEEKRGLSEQEFLLDDQQKERISTFLKNNIQPGHNSFDYDTYFDNCTTRIRDMFTKIFGDSFVTGQLMPKDSRLTFRDEIDQFCPQQHKYWLGLGMHIFYASRTDKVMDNYTGMNIPVNLSKGLSGATINGKKLCGTANTILSENISWPTTPNYPFIILLVVAILTIASLLYRQAPIWGKLMSFLVLFSTGLLGCAILYLWMLDGDPSWKNNFNILWALPTNLIVPFLGRKTKAKYAVGAVCLLGVSFVLHILKIQELPLFEIGSILLALLFIYGLMYRTGTTKDA